MQAQGFERAALRPWGSAMLLAVVMALAACGGGSDDPPSEVSATIGAAGGTVNGPDGVQMVVPAGALAQDTKLTIARVTSGASDGPPGYTAATPIYEFTPHGLLFAQPVTIRMPFAVPAGSADADIFMASPGEDWHAQQATINGGVAEWQRLTLSYGGVWGCAISGNNTDPYPCTRGVLGALVAATPAQAMTTNLFSNGTAHSLNGEVSLAFTLIYSAARDCGNASVSALRAGRNGRLLDQPVSLTPIDSNPQYARGRTNFNLTLGHADNGNVTLGFHFRCTRPNGNRQSASFHHFFHVAAPQPPASVAPVVGTQPLDQTVTAPATATFAATATGTPAPTWQWQRSTDGGNTFTDIAGATAASYTTPATTAADSGTLFRAVATNTAGSINSHAATLTVNAATAATNLYEGFAYTTGETLAGKSGGSGWSGPWTVTDGSGQLLADSASGYIVSGLNYSDAAGNTLVASGGAWQTDAGVFFGQARRLSTATSGTAGTSRWISYLVNQAPTTTGINYASASPGTGYSFGASALAGGVGNNGAAFVNCFYCSSTGNEAPISGWTAGSTALVLVRVDFAASGNDTMSLWINPPLTGALPAPTVVGSQANFGEALSGLTLAWGDNRSFVFDELRVGGSVAAVTPHLPPSATGSTVFSIDFEGTLPPQIAIGGATVEGVQGYAGLGPTGNTFAGSFLRSETGNTVTITLTNLPLHQWLSLDFLFAAIDSLDGTGSFPAGDFFRITVDGVDVFRESFANATTSQIQSYAPPTGVQLARMVDLGFSGPGGFHTDSAYWLGGDPRFQRIPHTASTVTITLWLEGTPQGLDDESWAIDNLRIVVGP